MSKKIMIVEDEKAFHDLYTIMFEGKGSTFKFNLPLNDERGDEEV